MALSGQERREALRAAIKSADGWDSYRELVGKNLGEMSMGELQEAFNVLWMDWTLEQWQETHGSQSVTPSLPIPEPVNPVTPSDNSRDDLAKAKALLDILRGNGTVDAGQVAAIVRHETGHISERLNTLESAIKDMVLPTRVTIIDKGIETPVEGLSHYLLPALLRMIKCRQTNGLPPNIWLAGPTGSGKTTAAAQVAKALVLPFYLHGSAAMAFEYVGFVDAGGKYHSTGLRQAWEHGGVVLLDECDGSDNAALLAINPMTAGNLASFPDSPTPIPRHKDCIIIAAGNTYGNGATPEFIGRAKIDAAFLSRFPAKLPWDYDLALEQAMCGNVQWAKRVQAARERARKSGTKIVIDPRHSLAGAAMLAAGFSESDTAKYTYLAGLTPEQARIVEG
jgi:hypothetical protein